MAQRSAQELVAALRREDEIPVALDAADRIEAVLNWLDEASFEIVAGPAVSAAGVRNALDGKTDGHVP